MRNTWVGARHSSRLLITMLVACAVFPVLAQDKAEGPTSEKAQKTYAHAFEYLHKRQTEFALEEFKKADKQDGGHCVACQKKIIKYGLQLRDFKAAETAAEEMVMEADAKDATGLAIAHYQLGIVLFNKGLDKHKDEYFSRAHEEMTRALGAREKFSDAILADGEALAYLKRDDEAKAQFERFVKMRPEDSPDRRRAMRFILEPELARERMAPPFEVTTLEGKRISLDDLTGKVVLIDFWATWCAPCREALPHMKQIAKKFEGQPLLVLSVSLDDDEQKWREFVAKNGMTWPQYRDGGFTGPVATLFSVKAIPQTFTIDADGVLQDQHIGDASVEGKLKKLVARAAELEGGGKALE